MTTNYEQIRAQIHKLLELYQQGKLSDAMVHGEALASRFPDEPATANLLGAVYAESGNLEQAAASYTRALQIKPDFAEAHNNLGDVLRIQGKTEDAIARYRSALQIRPDFAEAHCNLGDALIELGEARNAIASFEKALTINPDFVVALNNLGAVLNRLGRYAEALPCLRRALELQPNLAEGHNNLGVALRNIGRAEDAAASYRRALEYWPDYAGALINLGDALVDLGNQEEALANFHRALECEPRSAPAHRSLSTLKEFQADDPQIRQMLELLDRPELRDDDRAQLNFALAKAYDDTGACDRAYACLAEGNRLRKAELRFDIAAVRASFADIRETFSKAMPAENKQEIQEDTGHCCPVFILGMPRSGTTLVEQILASHSRVCAAGELLLLGQTVGTIDWRSTQLTADHLRRLRESYLSGLEEICRSAPYATDKMPSNFYWIGFIASALPEAKIVHVKRDARATCWSNYSHYFADRHSGYAYDLADITAYYKLYADLMRFWQERFPKQIYDLQYEALIEHQQKETRILLEHVGLNWEDQCMDFHNTRRTVQTASATQVRNKLYPGSSDAWRNYERHLGGQFDSLEGL